MKKLIAMMLMLASVFFIACEDEEVEKTFLEKLDMEMAADIEAMKNAEGFKAIEALNNFDDPFSVTKGKIGSTVFSDISNYLVPFNPKTVTKSDSKEGIFNFDLWVGTYTWNNTYGMWDIQHGIPSDNIVIIFPSDENNMDVNDVTFTLYAFEEIGILEQDDYGVYYYDYYPTYISADLYINDGTNNTKYVGLEYESTWDSYGEPLALDIEVFLTPFTFGGELVRTSTSLRVDFDIYLNETLLVGIGASGTFEDESYEHPITISGYVQYREVRIDANVDAQSIMELFDDLESDNPTYTAETALIAINEAVTVTISKNGDEIAEIVIKLDEENEPLFVLVYANGDEEDAAEFFESFVNHMEELLDIIGFQLEDTFGED